MDRGFAGLAKAKFLPGNGSSIYYVIASSDIFDAPSPAPSTSLRQARILFCKIKSNWHFLNPSSSVCNIQMIPKISSSSKQGRHFPQSRMFDFLLIFLVGKFHLQVKFESLNNSIVAQIMDHCFWTEVSVCHSSLCGLALAISVL